MQLTKALSLNAGGKRLTPASIANLSAWYDVSSGASTTSDVVRIDSSNRVSLIADRSGNSGVNCLCLNGVAGNYASAPDSAALSITGDLDLRIDVSMASWSAPAGTYTFLSKYTSTGNQRSFQFQIQSGTGYLYYVSSSDGINNSQTRLSSVNTGASAYARQWVRVTHDVDDGAGGNVITFYKSADGVSWTQVSTHTHAGTTSRYDSTSILEIGSTIIGTTDRLLGNVYRAQIRNNILNDGTGIVFDANFTAASKLATSFTESSSNAATVTINSSGDLGARICGERDLVQLSTSKQPIYLAHTGTNYGYLRGATGDIFTSPDAAVNSITGDIDIRWYGIPASWTPGANQCLISKFHTTSNQKSWYLVLAGAGIYFQWSPDGSTDVSALSSSAGLTDGVASWVRVTLDVDNGAGKYEVKFYKSTDGTNWTQIGSTTTGGSTTSIYDSTTPLNIGAWNNGTQNLLSARTYRAQVLNGIGGTVVADFDPALYTSGTTFTASTGETWTLNGGSTIVTRTCCYFDGSDDYMGSPWAMSTTQSAYPALKQISWTNLDTFLAATATGASYCLRQSTGTPAIDAIIGTGTASNTGLSLGADGIVTWTNNGTAISNRVNRGAAVTATGSSVSPASGVWLGCENGALRFANFTFIGAPIYSAAHDTNTQDTLVVMLGNQYQITV